MIRSRDVILFVLVVWVLLLAISVTVWQDSTARTVVTDKTTDWQTAGTTAPDVRYQAVPLETTEGTDRAATIARLQEKIAAGEIISDPMPSVVESESATPVAASTTARAVQRCPYPDDSLGYISTWPVRSMNSELSEGARLFYTEEVVNRSVSATTTPENQETVRTTWLQLPQFPQPLASAACVPSEVIGLHTNGTLLFNVDAAAYSSVDENTLIGYARDGYPIYGQYDGDVDACGGYQHPTGYRYVIHPDDTTFLQCFTAAPQAIRW